MGPLLIIEIKKQRKGKEQKKKERKKERKKRNKNSKEEKKKKVFFKNNHYSSFFLKKKKKTKKMRLEQLDSELVGRRKVLTQACDRCRSKKRKCDGMQPCARCTKAGQMCEFRYIMRKPGRKKGS